jgi:hypothetical protein
MGFFSWLFGGSDDNRGPTDRQQDAARKLSPAMPMAGAGAELDGERNQSETEDALKRAAGNDPS